MQSTLSQQMPHSALDTHMKKVAKSSVSIGHGSQANLTQPGGLGLMPLYELHKVGLQRDSDSHQISEALQRSTCDCMQKSRVDLAAGSRAQFSWQLTGVNNI